MTIFFSPTTNAFYDDTVWDAALPDDAAEVTRERHAELIQATTRGQIISAGADGSPVASDAPSPPPETLALMARRRRDAEITAVRWMVDRHRDEVALGLTTSLTSEDYLVVLSHIQALRDVPEQDAFPTGVDWPILPPELLATGD